VDQAILADFIAEGHFAHHIRRMRTLYAERQAVLVESATRELPDCSASPRRTPACTWSAGFRREWTTAWQQGLAAAHGVEAPPLSAFCLESTYAALALGYAAFTTAEIRDGVERLARALQGTAAG
jgi:GntR family transcriptional regulator/MocR family aminotransferase